MTYYYVACNRPGEKKRGSAQAAYIAETGGIAVYDSVTTIRPRACFDREVVAVSGQHKPLCNIFYTDKGVKIDLSAKADIIESLPPQARAAFEETLERISLSRTSLKKPHTQNHAPRC